MFSKKYEIGDNIQHHNLEYFVTPTQKARKVICKGCKKAIAKTGIKKHIMKKCRACELA